MALARLGGSRRPENFTWPGFVDVLATLLMVIIFVLMVFVLIQVNLAYRVSGQDETLGKMRQELVSLGELLNIERNASADLAADLARIANQLTTTTSERDALMAQLATATAALDARTNELDRLGQLQSATEAELAETVAALAKSTTDLGDANARNSNNLGKISALEDQNAASRAEIIQMTNALTALRQRMEDLRALLAEKEAQAARDKVAIASLGKSLNNALASRVQELKNFRSEFFGRLREYLSGRDDVQIVGDRFVFQSEVLFAAGQADIGPAGEEQLAKLALALGEIADSIPADIQWILQVDGHTDNVPIRAGRYADNWDLSTERALSVVRFLARNGVPATRLAATGYGEFQPLDTGDSDDARRRNRRIELKITQRVTAKQQ
ncbi:peptidoglycan -binding protein [Alphaproteobacteria bacterium]|nr:peptidoglycan -binding protein [Alphaproteobacteria bacterium]